MTTTTQTPVTAPGMPEEVVTRTPVQDVTLPGGAGILALVTLDNGHDHTRPNTFGPQTIAGLQATVDGLRARAEAGEIQAVGITGKPFVFAVGADLSGVPYVTRARAGPGHRPRGPRGLRVDHGPPGADLRVRQRRGHGRRRRDRPRLRLPHHLARACRRSRCPRPSSAWCPAGAAATCCRTSSAPPTPSRSSSRTRCRRTGCSRPRRSRRSASPTCCSSRPTSSRTRCAGPPPSSPAPSPCSAARSTATRPPGTPRATPPGRSCSRGPAVAHPARCAPSSWCGPPAPRPATTPSPPRTPRSAT